MSTAAAAAAVMNKTETYTLHTIQETNHVLRTSGGPVRDGDREDGGSSTRSTESGSPSGTNSRDEAEKKHRDRILTKSETIAVNRTKYLVYLALFLAAAIVGILTYFVLSTSEWNAMVTDFDALSKSITVKAGINVRNTFGHLQELSLAMTAHALSSNSTWPNVTMPFFDQLFTQAQERSGIDFVMFVPYVTEENKAGWESYAQQHRTWIKDDLHYRGIDDTMDPFVQGIHPYIPSDEEQDLHADEHSHEEGEEGHDDHDDGEGEGEEGQHDDEDHYDEIDHHDEVETEVEDDHDDHDHGVTVTEDGGQRRRRRHTRILQQDLVDDHDDHDDHEDEGGTHEGHEDEEEHDEHHEDEGGHDHGLVDGGDFYLPMWELAPVPRRDSSFVGLDLSQHPVLGHALVDAIVSGAPLVSQTFDVHFILSYTDHTVKHHHDDHPKSVILQPVYETLHKGSHVVGVLIGALSWDNYFVETLDERAGASVIVEVDESCSDGFAYKVTGSTFEYLGHGIGDKHDTTYNDLRRTHDFAGFAQYSETSNNNTAVHHDEHCTYQLNIYPTHELESTYRTQQPILFALLLVAAFLFTTCVFLLYDYMVQRRQNKLLSTAERTTAIVSSLFPKEVRDRILADAEEQANKETQNKKNYSSSTSKSSMSDFLNDNEEQSTRSAGGSPSNINASKPIADLFPSATVMFADISGFTAWSSMREPCQVFTLLETIYNAFDKIAKMRRVYKVETIGDCYVAVAGLPEPRADHAVVMVRFSKDCLIRMNGLLGELASALGPDTASLGMRFGLHSGPVTAGVLRGERARFQLFGDTVNTASRIESTGLKNMIHLSQETADILQTAGKGHWIVPRKEEVSAKGKGTLKTFWLNFDGTKSNSTKSGSTSDDADYTHNDVSEANDAAAEPKVKYKCISTSKDEDLSRLVEWNSEVLARLLHEIVEQRLALNEKADPEETLTEIEHDMLLQETLVLDEVKDIVVLPDFKGDKVRSPQQDDAGVNPTVKAQLRDFVRSVASLYNTNPFHNFHHASHVTMSVVKLLSRIVAPDLEHLDGADDVASSLHDHTYGITSDPLTRFAVVFSALIHDAGHHGIPNAQLIKEKASIASFYKEKSIAEQNSVDICWALLMDPSFKELRHTIYATEPELKRFRQLVVNTVMATDIMDKDLSSLRKARWNKAFTEEVQEEEKSVTINRKATIVIEHLIQASDVAHTMQHWHIFRKWNKNFFTECYEAYRAGRAATDPSENWYTSEIGFFDFYIIPLAKKLKDCGVFGVSSDEYLIYAIQNRKKWEAEGQAIVAEMVESFKSKEADEANLVLL